FIETNAVILHKESLRRCRVFKETNLNLCYCSLSGVLDSIGKEVVIDLLEQRRIRFYCRKVGNLPLNFTALHFGLKALTHGGYGSVQINSRCAEFLVRGAGKLQ